jgi:U3 small nucleolar RNA-associated protein 23
MDKIIDFAKTLERRRCGHLPEDFPEPLSTMECFKAVVDPKSAGVNKHKLVVVCQDDEVRRALRAIPGVPQIYLKRSVMILEPMASESAEFRAREEKSKYRAGIRGAIGPTPGSGAKRKRAAEEDGEGEEEETGEKKKKKKYGPKGANPLAKQKSKKELAAAAAAPARKDVKTEEKVTAETTGDGGDEAPAKKKRKRKPRKGGEAGGEGGEAAGEGGEVVEAAEA